MSFRVGAHRQENADAVREEGDRGQGDGHRGEKGIVGVRVVAVVRVKTARRPVVGQDCKVAQDRGPKDKQHQSKGRTSWCTWFSRVAM